MQRWDEDLAALGRRLREKRKALGFSQEKFAARVGIDRSYMGGIERGRRNITFFVLCDLVTGLGCDLADLLRDLPAMARPEEGPNLNGG